MSGNSTGILSQVATSMMNFGAPMLLDEKDWEEAERMADAGLLQRHDPHAMLVGNFLIMHPDTWARMRRELDERGATSLSPRKDCP